MLSDFFLLNGFKFCYLYNIMHQVLLTIKHFKLSGFIEKTSLAKKKQMFKKKVTMIIKHRCLKKKDYKTQNLVKNKIIVDESI